MAVVIFSLKHSKSQILMEKKMLFMYNPKWEAYWGHIRTSR